MQVEENITEAELREMVELGDYDGDGHIDREEFLKIMLQTNLFRL